MEYLLIGFERNLMMNDDFLDYYFENEFVLEVRGILETYTEIPTINDMTAMEIEALPFRAVKMEDYESDDVVFLVETYDFDGTLNYYKVNEETEVITKVIDYDGMHEIADIINSELGDSNYECQYDLSEGEDY